MSLNRAMLIGYAGHDLEELRYLPSGQPLASFSVATDESFTDKNGEKQERVDWHQVVVYLLEQIAANLELPPEVLYFWARRMPPDVVPTEYIDADRVTAALRLFRAALKRDGGRTSAGIAPGIVR